MTTITIEEVCQKALRLPCSPVLLPRIIEVMEREDASIAELEKIICMDPVLASSTLRLANSAYFASGSARVDRLDEAIHRLGLTEIYRLAALSLAGRWMALDADGYRWEAGDSCRLALVTAVAAEYLAETMGALDPRSAYTAGLVHEVGKLAVAYSCGEYFGRIRAHQQEKRCTWLRAEKAVLGFDHADVGSRLLGKWNFPDRLVAVATFNPPTHAAPAEMLPLIVNVHAAKYLAVSMGAGVAEDGFLFELHSGLLLEWGYTAEVLEKALPEVLTRSSRLLRENLLHGVLKF
ncbi:MAG: HDOD domain-containing protein [Opitutaceae bacterium]|nr:HDOD domain-containing protein [Opitutaceae bacterium]